MKTRKPVRKRKPTYKINQQVIAKSENLKTKSNSLRTKIKPKAVLSSVAKSKAILPDVSKSKTKKTAKGTKNITSTPKEELNPAITVSEIEDSYILAKQSFEWLLNPIEASHFFSQLWEKKPLFLRRNNPNYYKGLFSCKEFDKILRKKRVCYTESIDVTQYVDGKRVTLNPTGRAYASVVWNYYEKGCSVRFLNPQTYCTAIWQLNSVLQDYFGSFVGANVYLTPPGSQGFAPHYDDIEAFVLQLEGRKEWKLYKPRNANEVLPRFSSPNFQQDEIGEPVLTVELEPGDLLYFPRGIIHQAQTPKDIHSLHITLSTFQRNTWGDFLKKCLPRALEIAMEDDVEFRRSLPIGYMQYMGVSKMDEDSDERSAFEQKVGELTRKLIDMLPIDAAVDQMAKEYLHESLPPFLMPYEKECSIHNNNERDNSDLVNFNSNTEIRIIRPTSIRLLVEETVKLYHSVENTCLYQEIEPQYILIDEEYAPIIESLINLYPNYVAIKDLSLPSFEKKMNFTRLLYEKGIIIFKDRRS